MTIQIVERSSCLHFRHPAENVSGSGDYIQIWTKVLETGEETLLFQGEKWNKEDFLKKANMGTLFRDTFKSEIKSDE